MDESEKIKVCFAAELRKRRLRAKMSQDDLAAQTGLAQSYISLLEHGDRLPGIDVFFRIARALKIKPTTLLAELEKHL